MNKIMKRLLTGFLTLAKATQISQFDLTLEKDSNWKIVK